MIPWRQGDIHEDDGCVDHFKIQRTMRHTSRNVKYGRFCDNGLLPFFPQRHFHFRVKIGNVSLITTIEMQELIEIVRMGRLNYVKWLGDTIPKD